MERLYCVTISEEVRHIHFHLIPREKNNTNKGINLIQQATQKKNNNGIEINSEMLFKFVNKCKIQFLDFEHSS